MSADNGSVDRDDGSWITDTFLQDILQNVDPSKEIFIVNKDVKFAIGKAENYLSVIFRVEVHYRRGNTGEVEKQHLIVKSYPDGEYIRKFIADIGAFNRELSVYSTALPAISSFAEKRLKNGQVPHMSANMFTTSRPDTVVLEDLRCQGFKMVDRKKMLDLQHCRLLVKQLARLHGLSAALHEHSPDILNHYDEVMFNEKNRGNMEQSLFAQMKSLSKNVQSWPGFEDYGAKLEKVIPVLINRITEDCKPQEGGFKVLCHGDCWVNNYMFKYSSTGEATDVRFVDFQLSSLGTPAMDLIYFLCSSPQNEVRASHIDELLTEYHSQLGETLTSMGCNADVFSFQDLNNEMKRMARFAIYVSTVVLPVVLVDTKDALDLAELTEEEVENSGMISWEKLHGNTRFMKAFQQLLPYLDELGAFD